MLGQDASTVVFEYHIICLGVEHPLCGKADRCPAIMQQGRNSRALVRICGVPTTASLEHSIHGRQRVVVFEYHIICLGVEHPLCGKADRCPAIRFGVVFEEGSRMGLQSSVEIHYATRTKFPSSCPNLRRTDNGIRRLLVKMRLPLFSSITSFVWGLSTRSVAKRIVVQPTNDVILENNGRRILTKSRQLMNKSKGGITMGVYEQRHCVRRAKHRRW
jgi:hypothetical protein